MVALTIERTDYRVYETNDLDEALRFVKWWRSSLYVIRGTGLDRIEITVFL